MCSAFVGFGDSLFYLKIGVTMFIFTKGTSKLPVLLVAMLTLVALAIACSGETVTVVQTVVVEKEVKGDTVVETVIVEKEVKGDTVVQTVVVAATPIPVQIADRRTMRQMPR